MKTFMLGFVTGSAVVLLTPAPYIVWVPLLEAAKQYRHDRLMERLNDLEPHKA